MVRLQFCYKAPAQENSSPGENHEAFWWLCFAFGFDFRREYLLLQPISLELSRSQKLSINGEQRLTLLTDRETDECSFSKQSAVRTERGR